MIKSLSALLAGLTDNACPELSISAIANSTQMLTEDCLFIAQRGISSHALDHLIPEKADLPIAIAYQPPYDISRFKSCRALFIAVPKLNEVISTIGQRFYAPHFSRPIIGVTGTNGKTSTTQFIAQLSDQQSYAVIGSMGYGHFRALKALSHTTPDALSLQSILAELSQNHRGVALEVSSHALELHRVSAVNIDTAIFTNLSQDHLDFHHDMKAYFAAKSKLFEFPSLQTAIINIDDDFGYRLAKSLTTKTTELIAYGQHERAKTFASYAHIDSQVLSRTGTHADISLKVGEQLYHQQLSLELLGEFNSLNAIAAILALHKSGEKLNQLFARASRLQTIAGRLEAVDLGDNKRAIIDYSHSPGALEKVLKSLRKHLNSNSTGNHFIGTGKIYTVFGCGGDRDKGKRPLMAEAVDTYSDFGIITDDNPRTEPPEDITDDILNGDIEKIRFKVIRERKAAINFGLNALKSGDILLIAGKGSENYQIIGTKKFPFSDLAVVKSWLSAQQHSVPCR